jgi:hypothetical protein
VMIALVVAIALVPFIAAGWLLSWLLSHVGR